MACVAGNVQASDDNNPSARTGSGATSAQIMGERAFAHGGQRHAFHAVYLDGECKGSAAVAKAFIQRGRIEDKAFVDDREVVRWALRFVTKFNGGGAGASAVAALGGPLRLNVPEAFYLADGTLWRGSGRAGARRYLVEPYVHGFKKYNSNTGFVHAAGSSASSRDVSEALQALSHYSYHSSGGMLVLCDLQCGTASARGGGGLVVTDPVIMSRFKGKYGPTDLGSEGIVTFFSQHNCGRFCDARWTRPKNSRYAVLPVVAGTSNTAHSYAPAARGPGLGGIAEDDEDDWDD